MERTEGLWSISLFCILMLGVKISFLTFISLNYVMGFSGF